MGDVLKDKDLTSSRQPQITALSSLLLTEWLAAHRPRRPVAQILALMARRSLPSRSTTTGRGVVSTAGKYCNVLCKETLPPFICAIDVDAQNGSGGEWEGRLHGALWHLQ